VRLALEENHLLPGDPLRVYGSYTGAQPGDAHTQNETEAAAHEAGHTAAPSPDPTTLKPQETNPFSGE
jgi:hypothetical protein